MCRARTRHCVYRRSRQVARGLETVLRSGPATFPDIDTIDVTALGEDVFELNHDVFSAARSAIDDIGRVLQGVRPPGMRTPHLRGMPVGTTPPQYWRYPQ